MTGYFTPKEWLALGAAAVTIPLAMAFAFVSMSTPLPDRAALNSDSERLTGRGTTDADLINHCRETIAEISSVSPEALQIDDRSTGLRGNRFNVHGLLMESGRDFQCWYNDDRTFDYHYISRNSLKDNGLGAMPF